MNRREFISGMGSAMALAGCSGFPCCGRSLRLGCQLWSVNDIWKKRGDILSVFPDLAAMGYEGVQALGFWKCDPDQLEKALKTNNLVIADMPVWFEHVETDEAFAKTVAFCKRFDVDYLYIPWFQPKTLAEWREFAAKLDAIGARLAPHGIRIGYHHHLHEFAEKLDGAYPADVLMAHPTFNFELDVGPVLEAGRNPAEVLRKLQGRVPTIHAKPYPGTACGAPDDRQDWPAIVAAACAAGTKWLVVECEKRKDTFDDIRQSAAYLRVLI